MSTTDPKNPAAGSVEQENERDLFSAEEGAEEPAEAKWLLARESDPAAPAPSAELAAEHDKLASLLADLPVGPDDDSWHEEVLRKLAAESSPRAEAAAASTASPEAVAKAIDASSNVVSLAWWRRPLTTWAGGGAVAAAAAVLLWTRVAPEPPDRAELAYETFHDEAAPVRTKEVAVGDRLVVKANPRGAGDLRVFREDGTLVARCPEEPRCAAKPDGELVLEVTLDAPVQYRIILVVGAKPGALDAAGDSSMNAYLEAARAANARIVIKEPLEVH